MELNHLDYLEDVEYVTEYNFSSSYGVSGILRNWEKNKEYLYNKLGNVIVKSDPIDVSVKDNREVQVMMDKFEAYLYNNVHDYTKVNTIRYFLNSDAVGMVGFVENKVQKDYKTLYKNINEDVGYDIDIKAGMKFSRALKLFFNEGEQEKVKNIQNEYSTYAQKLKCKKLGKIHLSIHPLDYLSISTNNHNWGSCHNIEDGDYRYGNYSYIGDSVTLVAYYSTDEEFDQEIGGFGRVKWNSKQWRMLVHIDKDENGNPVVIYNRQYPYNSIALQAEVDKMVMKYFDNGTLKDLESIGNFYEKDIYPNSVEPYSLHYNDISEDNGCMIRVSNAIEEKKLGHFISVGSATPCVSCGSHYADSEYSGMCGYCDTHNICALCDCREDEDNMIYVMSEDISICRDCYERDYTCCQICGSIVHQEDSRHNETLDQIICMNCHTAFINKERDITLVIDQSFNMINNGLMNENEAAKLYEKMREDYFAVKTFADSSLLRSDNLIFKFTYVETSNEFYQHCNKMYMYWAQLNNNFRTLEINKHHELEHFELNNPDMPRIKTIKLRGFASIEVFESVKAILKEINPEAEIIVDTDFILPILDKAC